MANNHKFKAKNGLQTQNISFVDLTGTDTISVSMLGTDTLSFSGNAGQLFSLSDSLSGTLFSVNDVSGISSIEVDDTGTIRFAETSGNVLIGTATDDNSNKLQVSGGISSTGTITAANLTLSGDFTVSGTTTTLNTANLNVEDKNITVNYHASSDTSSNANGAGLTIQDAVNSSTDATILWNTSQDEFDFSHGIDVSSGGYKINGTTVIDASRALTSINYLTAGGNINTTSGVFQINGTTVIDSATRVYTSSVQDNSPISFLNGTNGSTGSGAQGIKVASVYAGTSYSNSAPSGMVNALNGYQVANTTAIDSSRNTSFNNSNAVSFLSTNGYWVGGTRRIDGSGNLENIGTISSGNITVGDSSTAKQVRAHYSDGSYMTLTGFGLEMNRGASYIRPTTDGDKTLYIGGADASLDWSAIHFRSGNGLYMTGTQFIDTSRNLTNIGTITASGQLRINNENILLAETGNNERSIRIQNSTVTAYFGVEGSSANRFAGSAANNMFLGTTTADGIEFATNNTVRATINSTGAATFNSDVHADSFSLNDDKYMFFGTSDDARIRFDGTDSLYITCTNGTADKLKTNANTTMMMQANGNQLFTMYANSEVVVNEDSNDINFRVESNSNTHMLFVDGGKNTIGIGTSVTYDHQQASAIDLNYDGTIWAGSTYWAGGLNTGCTFYKTTSGEKYKHSSRQAVMHYQNSQGGSHHFYSAAGGTAGNVISWQELAEFDRDEVVFNNGGVDQNFRVESNNQSHMLFVDAGNDCVNIANSTDLGANLNISGNVRRGGYTTLSNFNSNNDVIAFNYQIPASSSTVTPIYSGVSSAGGSFIHMESGGGGTTHFRAARHGTDSSAFTYTDAGKYLTLNPAAKAQGALIVNDDGNANIDFRVESDTNANMLFVDAGNNRVILGGNTQDGAGTLTFNSGSGAIRHVHPAGTAKDNLLFAISGTNNGFQTTIDSSNNITYKFHTGGNTEAVRFGTTESVFNENSVDRDFRVESNNKAHMLFVDGGNDEIRIPANVGAQSMASLIVRDNGASLEFGHQNNTAGYFGTLGAFGNNGHPYLGFSCASESGANTFSTFGHKGNIIKGDLSGNLIFAQVSTASATGQTPVERMRINSLGDVSIGTTGGNGRALEVHTANDYIAKFKSTDAYGGIIIEDSASTNNYNRIAVTGNSMSFATNNVTRVMINDSGNIGIGTSSPEGRLMVEVTGANATPPIKINRGLDGGRIQLQYSGNETGYGEIGQMYAGTGRTQIWIGANLNSFSTGHNSSPTQHDVNYASWFGDWDSYRDRFTIGRIASGTASSLMVINSSGNVGIGTTSPAHKLQVVGNAMLSTSDGFMYLSNVGVNNAGIYVRGRATQGTLRSHTTTDFRWEIGGSEKAILNSTGFGIGTTAPNAPLSFGVTSLNSQVALIRDNGNSRTGFGITSNYGVRVFGPSDASASGNVFEVGQMLGSNGTTYQNTRFAVRYDGNVGIGTTSPGAKLTITDENSGQPMLQVRNFATSATGSFGNAHSVELRSATSTTTHGVLIHHHENNIGRRSLEVADANGVFATFVQGKVGIGTAAPSNALSVTGVITAGGNFTAASVGGTPGDANTAEIGPGYINLARDDTASAKQILFGKNGAVHSYLETTSAGLNIGGANVGIGTTAPDQNLTVKATNAKISAQSTGDGQTIGFQARYLNHTTLYGSFEYTTGDAQLYIDNNFQGNNGVYSNIRFRNCPNASSTLTDRMIIQGSTGNVGIGTTSPSQKLHVNGGIVAESSLAFVNGSHTITASMLSTDTLSFSGNAGQLFSLSDSLTGTIFSVNDVSGIASIEVEDSGEVRIAPTIGNVLIGTSTDDGSNKLQVAGTISLPDNKEIKLGTGDDFRLSTWDGSTGNYYHDNGSMNVIETKNTVTGLEFHMNNKYFQIMETGPMENPIFKAQYGVGVEMYHNPQGAGGSLVTSSTGITINGTKGLNVLQLGRGDTGISFDASYNAVIPYRPDISSGTADDYLDLGKYNVRWDDVYATNGTIQTSDQNEKQDFEALSDAETRVAVAAKGLLKKFRWKSAVVEKGDNARIHFGIIAQDLKAAFEAEGLDASKYGMFTSNTWFENGQEHTRMGVRYSELLAFIISAI